MKENIIEIQEEIKIEQEKKDIYLEKGDKIKILKEEQILDKNDKFFMFDLENLDKISSYEGKRVKLYYFGDQGCSLVTDGIFQNKEGLFQLKNIGEDKNNHITIDTLKGHNFELKITDGSLVLDIELPGGPATFDFDYFS